MIDSLATLMNVLTRILQIQLLGIPGHTYTVDARSYTANSSGIISGVNLVDVPNLEIQGCTEVKQGSISIGGFQIIVDTDGSLKIRDPDGGLTPLVINN